MLFWNTAKHRKMMSKYVRDKYGLDQINPTIDWEVYT